MDKKNDQPSLFDVDELQRVDGLNYKIYKTTDAYGRTYNKKIIIKTKKQAIDEVEKNADEVWWHKTKEVIRDLAKKKLEITSDDVWEELDRLQIPRPHQPSAMGSVFRACSQSGCIEKTGKYVPSRQLTNHQRDVAVWRSCFF